MSLSSTYVYVHVYVAFHFILMQCVYYFIFLLFIHANFVRNKWTIMVTMTTVPSGEGGKEDTYNMDWNLSLIRYIR